MEARFSVLCIGPMHWNKWGNNLGKYTSVLYESIWKYQLEEIRIELIKF